MDAVTWPKAGVAEFRVKDLVSDDHYCSTVGVSGCRAVGNKGIHQRAGGELVGLDRTAAKGGVIPDDLRRRSSRLAGRAGAVRARIDVLARLRGRGRRAVDVRGLGIGAVPGSAAVALHRVRLGAPAALIVVLRRRLVDRECVARIRGTPGLGRGSKTLEGLVEMATAALVRELRESNRPVLVLRQRGWSFGKVRVARIALVLRETGFRRVLALRLALGSGRGRQAAAVLVDGADEPAAGAARVDGALRLAHSGGAVRGRAE